MARCLWVPQTSSGNVQLDFIGSDEGRENGPWPGGATPVSLADEQVLPVATDTYNIVEISLVVVENTAWTLAVPGGQWILSVVNQPTTTTKALGIVGHDGTLPATRNGGPRAAAVRRFRFWPFSYVEHDRPPSTPVR